MSAVEEARQKAQREYDLSRSRLERNVKGQFATPYPLALAIARDALGRLEEPATMLEPSCGTGAFVSAARALEPKLKITGVEKDEAVFRRAAELWRGEAGVDIVRGDFFERAGSLAGFDLLIDNPPYSRHHHLSAAQKRLYGAAAAGATGRALSQLAGLHAYFVLVGTAAVRPGGIASWLVPAELFSVNYGETVREYITHDVTVERIHFFDHDELQFADALVSSCVLVLRRKRAHADDAVDITAGPFDEPARCQSVSIGDLRGMGKWQHFFMRAGREPSNRIGDYFTVKRGLSTGAESFYAKERAEWHDMGIDDEWLVPVLPPPRSMRDSRVDSDRSGWPVGYERALLSIPRDVGEADLPKAVAAYLGTCPDKVRNSYTARHRAKWYSIERREPAPIVCTYMSRSEEHPFRFVRNRSKAVVTTAYLCLYPRGELSEGELDEICASLNSIDPEVLICSGREYGGGLKKLEPKELSAVPFTVS